MAATPRLSFASMGSRTFTTIRAMGSTCCSGRCGGGRNETVGWAKPPSGVPTRIWRWARFALPTRRLELLLEQIALHDLADRVPGGDVDLLDQRRVVARRREHVIAQRP